MPLPSYQKFMLPTLQLLADGAPRAARDINDQLAARRGLTAEQRRERLAGGNLVLIDRASWARTYMKQAGLIEYPQRGYSRITSRGREALLKAPKGIDLKYLRQFPEFREFQQRSGAAASPTSPVLDASSCAKSADATPGDLMEAGYLRLRASVESELLARVMAGSPEFFENLVIRLLVALGYGGSMAEAETVGRAGDGGIDGVVKQDRLGLDSIYVQAKRWGAPVGRPVVQAFVGALHGVNARRGILFTTSTFTREATEYAANVGLKVVLVDGAALAIFMFDAGLGVTTASTYVVKQLDSDFFEDEAAPAAGVGSGGAPPRVLDKNTKRFSI
ncbi:MAG TPA: restriction endonuclease [Terriglobales bacterium]|jgi:restriction system protein